MELHSDHYTKVERLGNGLFRFQRKEKARQKAIPHFILVRFCFQEKTVEYAEGLKEQQRIDEKSMSNSIIILRTSVMMLLFISF